MWLIVVVILKSVFTCLLAMSVLMCVVSLCIASDALHGVWQFFAGVPSVGSGLNVMTLSILCFSHVCVCASVVLFWGYVRYSMISSSSSSEYAIL